MIHKIYQDVECLVYRRKSKRKVETFETVTDALKSFKEDPDAYKISVFVASYENKRLNWFADFKERDKFLF